jgi:hypothetical protein
VRRSIELFRLYGCMLIATHDRWMMEGLEILQRLCLQGPRPELGIPKPLSHPPPPNRGAADNINTINSLRLSLSSSTILPLSVAVVCSGMSNTHHPNQSENKWAKIG